MARTPTTRFLSMTLARLAFVSATALALLVLVSCEEMVPPKILPLPKMISVPAGSFMMGSPESEQNRWDDEGPRHSVTIGASFSVGVYEVTFAQWNACVDEGGCTHRANDYDVLDGDHPVIDVSWDDAQEYVKWLSEETGENYRLLSEAEWEYVARGGTSTARHWGESSDRQCAYANGADDAAKQEFPDWVTVPCNDGYVYPARVGTYIANKYGVHDVLGNVWEWTQDCWNEDYVAAPRDGSAWTDGSCSYAVIRGGSWDSFPRNIRSAVRYPQGLEVRDTLTGFRVARTGAPISAGDGSGRPSGGEVTPPEKDPVDPPPIIF